MHGTMNNEKYFYNTLHIALLRSLRIFGAILAKSLPDVIRDSHDKHSCARYKIIAFATNPKLLLPVIKNKNQIRSRCKNVF